MESELSLKNIVELLMRRIWVIVCAAIAGATVLFLITFFGVEPLYTSTASLYVYGGGGQQAANTLTESELRVSKQLVDTYIVIIKSNTVLSQVAERIGDPELDVEAIREKLAAQAIDSTEAFSVSVTDKDPAMAQHIVNTILDVAPAEIIRVVKAGSVEVIDYADLPEDPQWPILLHAVIGALLGAVLSVGGILLRTTLDTSVHDASDLTRTFPIPVIGEIPAFQAAGQTGRSGGGQQ